MYKFTNWFGHNNDIYSKGNVYKMWIMGAWTLREMNPWCQVTFTLTHPWSGRNGNTFRPRHNGRHFTDDTSKHIILNENVKFFTTMLLNFVSTDPINNIPALVQIMAWRRSGDKPLSEPMVVSLLAHICINRPQWVNVKHSRMMPRQPIAFVYATIAWPNC